MALHRMYHPRLADVSVGADVDLSGDEVQHAARVKRLEPGDPVELLDGQGTRVGGSVREVRKHRGEWAMTVRVESARHEPASASAVEVWSSPPKGDRLEWMVDQLSQIGASQWRPLMTDRTIVEPRAGKLERLTRVVMESMKQCGRSWRLTIGEPVAFQNALGPWEGGTVLLADGSGGDAAPRSGPVRLLVGPEGGWSPAELVGANEAGVRRVRLGPHVLRSETAAAVGAALLVQGRGESNAAGS